MNMNEIEQALRPGLISVSVVAQILGTSRAGAHLMARRGEIDAVFVGRRIFCLSAPLRNKLGLPPVEASTA